MRALVATFAALAAVPEAPEPVGLDRGGAWEGTNAAFERLVQRAIDRAQEALEGELVLWEDHASWERAWQVDSAHYRVRTTHSHYLGARIAQGLETMLGHFQRVLRSDYVPESRFLVWIFPDLDSYNAFGNANGADEHSSFAGSYYAGQVAERPAVALFLSNLLQLEINVTHAATHQFVHRAFPRSAPVGIDEGLACYFATYWAYPYFRGELYRLIDHDRYLPLETLLGDPLAAYAGLTHERFVELGMLFRYLLHFKEETRVRLPGEEPAPASFQDYLLAHLTLADPYQLPFQRLYGESFQRLDEELRTFEFPLD